MQVEFDGFVYSRFAEGPASASSREFWLARLPTTGRGTDFASQPYEQLAKVLRESGDDRGAKSVLITMENERWRQEDYGLARRCWDFVLWLTIGYGYDTWRALWFAAAFVTIGSLLFFWGRQADAITLVDKQNEYARRFNPFIYSLESFLPLVDLQQSRFWTPNASPHLGPKVLLSPFKSLTESPHQFGPNFGRYLRWYLWLHVLAGWFFTSMIIAGVTGLVRK